MRASMEFSLAFSVDPLITRSPEKNLIRLQEGNAVAKIQYVSCWFFTA